MGAGLCTVSDRQERNQTVPAEVDRVLLGSTAGLTVADRDSAATRRPTTRDMSAAALTSLAVSQVFIISASGFMRFKAGSRWSCLSCLCRPLASRSHRQLCGSTGTVFCAGFIAGRGKGRRHACAKLIWRQGGATEFDFRFSS